jgi:hypothetical protein
MQVAGPYEVLQICMSLSVKLSITSWYHDCSASMTIGTYGTAYYEGVYRVLEPTITNYSTGLSAVFDRGWVTQNRVVVGNRLEARRSPCLVKGNMATVCGQCNTEKGF